MKKKEQQVGALQEYWRNVNLVIRKKEMYERPWEMRNANKINIQYSRLNSFI
jgi:hypothetical protein